MCSEPQVQSSTELGDMKTRGAGLRMESMVRCLGVSGTQRRAALCGLWLRVMGIPSGSSSS